MQVGQHFYYLNLQSLDDWESGTRLILRSKVHSIHAPTEKVVSRLGRYFDPEECYATHQEAKLAMQEWLDKQQRKLKAIKQDLGAVPPA